MSTAAARLVQGGALALLACAAWLLVPRASSGGDERSRAVRVVLVDASASVRRARPRWTAWARSELEREARAAESAGEELGVIAFADDVAVRAPPLAPARLLASLQGHAGEPPFDPAAGSGSDGETRLAAALASASSWAADPRRASGRVVVLGDGTWTGDDPAPELARLARAGVRLELRLPPPPERSELAVEQISLPRAAEVGAPLAAAVQVRWTPGADALRVAPGARLLVTLSEAGGQRTLEHALALGHRSAGWTELVALGPAGPGRTDIVVRAELPGLGGGPDPCPENDALAASFRGADALLIGVLGEPAALAAAARVFRPSGPSPFPGVELVLVPPERLAEELPRLDALVAWDLSPARADPLLVEAFVRAGHGYLALAGWSFLAGWGSGAPEQPLARLLPLEPRASAAPPRDVVLLVDGSGSMAGEPFEMVRQAALALVAAAPPSDRLSLRFFTSGLEDELVLRERAPPGEAAAAPSAAELAERLLAARVPRGPTRILHALGELAAERRSQEHEALVLLLSDGREGRERDALERPIEAARETGAELAAARTALVAIAVGEEPDADFLRALLPSGAELAHARDLGELESVFRRSVAGERVREGVLALRTASSALAEEVLGAESAPPPLGRIVRSVARPGAEVVWESESGEPVLGVWRAGLGRSALLASLPEPEWAPAWSGPTGAGDPRPLGPLLRWLARAGEARPGSQGATEAPELAFEDGELELSGLPFDAPLLVTLRLLGAQDGAAGERTLELGPRLLSSGVLVPRVRTARLAGEPSFRAASVELPELFGGELLAAPRAVLPAEFRPARAGAPLAELWARLSGPDPGLAAPRGRQGQSRWGPACLAAGLALFFVWAFAPEGRQGIRAGGR